MIDFENAAYIYNRFRTEDDTGRMRSDGAAGGRKRGRVKTVKVDLCVIGGGSGGRTVSSYARMLDASVAMVEKRPRLGGDCLLFGCVPSKALLAAGHAIDAVRNAHKFGGDAILRGVDPTGVFRHVRGTIAAIEPHDSAEHFESLGVQVFFAPARFVGPDAIEAGDVRIEAHRFIVASGTSPLIPPIPGLADVPYLTNETIFDLPAIPEHLIVVGAGPMGVELAQAFRHLGAEVTILEKATLLCRDDPDLVAPLRARLTSEGIQIVEGAAVTQARATAAGIAMAIDGPDGTREIAGSHVLVAVGRRPNVEGMGLDAAGIAFDAKGIRVDSHLRTTNRRVYAVGDVTGDPQFSHLVVHHAKVAVGNALLRWPAKVDRRALPRVTYTSPEIAQVGLTEAEARAAGLRAKILHWRYADNDRAQAERATDGMIKVVVGPWGRILGAGIVGPNAGEAIQTWCLAIQERLGIQAIAGMIAPYPTFGYSNRKVAEKFFVPMLRGRFLRGLARVFSRLP